MSDTAVSASNDTTPTPDAPAVPDGFFLDGDAPRLGVAPIVAPAPMGGAGTPTDSTESATAPSLAVVSPVLTAPTMRPSDDRSEPSTTGDATDLPTLPMAPAARPAVIEDHPVTQTEPIDEQSEHPMAHLMPGRSKPTEASLRAAEIRAAQKAKSKKIKIGIAVGALVVSAIAGPPLLSWLTNAINEAGNTSTETPAD
jgi:hypothetical protein